MPNDPGPIDVTVVGAGLAGMAASIHLSRAGLRVLCIEADPEDTDPVGESLDWSAPDLLKALGLPMDHLLDSGIATYKLHVVLKLRDGSEQHYVPGAWLGKPPFNVDLRTLHVDRSQLDGAVREIFLRSGVTLIHDKVVKVETAGRTVSAIITAGGERITSRWFVDASGSGASLFPRIFRLPVREYGPRKVAMWDYFTVADSIEGTTLNADGAGPPYMEWVWQIPIHPNTVSVGYVSTGDSVKEKRQQGLSVQDIYKTQLQNFPALQGLAHSTAETSPRTTSFQCRAFENIVGPNWLVIGESAAMVDPMTSNGVTSALRHAAEASSLIVRYRRRRWLPSIATAMYSQRVLALAAFFNNGIEKILYDWPIRNRIGAFNAGDVYTIPAWSINVVYSRLRPRGVLSTMLFRALLASLTVGINVLYWFCSRSRSASPVCATS